MSEHAISNVTRLICALALALPACGGDDDSMSTCTFNAQVSGAIEWQSSGDPACSLPFATSSWVSASFMPLDGEVLSFGLEINNLKAEQTGTFTASVEVELRDRRRWETAAGGCSVQVSEQAFYDADDFGKRYLITGTGQCTAAAMPKNGASGTLTVAPFSFRFPAHF